MEPLFAHFMVHLEWPHRGHAQLDKLKSKTDVWTYAKQPHGMPQVYWFSVNATRQIHHKPHDWRSPVAGATSRRRGGSS